jgi:DNA-binding CsgD family transcriptional regulator
MHNSMVYSKITLRKKEILTLLNNGLTDKEIGLELHISINTVKTHLKEIYRILEAKNSVHACTLYNKLNLNL